MTRSLDELTAPDSSWPYVLELIAASPWDVRVIDADEDRRGRALWDAQVTVHSTLGAIAYGCGVIAIDHGWLRLMGAGVGDLQGVHPEELLDVDSLKRFPGIVVAHDVLGGRFAISGGGLDGVAPGEIAYWAPDSLSWMPTELGHSAFIDFALSERLADFYADLRWDGWEAEVEALAPDQGLIAYPPVWTSEGSGTGVTRSAVPMAELVGVAEEFAIQLRDVPDGTSVEIRGVD